VICRSLRSLLRVFRFVPVCSDKSAFDSKKKIASSSSPLRKAESPAAGPGCAPTVAIRASSRCFMDEDRASQPCPLLFACIVSSPLFAVFCSPLCLLSYSLPSFLFGLDSSPAAAVNALVAPGSCSGLNKPITFTGLLRPGPPAQPCPPPPSASFVSSPPPFCFLFLFPLLFGFPSIAYSMPSFLFGLDSSPAAAVNALVASGSCSGLNKPITFTGLLRPGPPAESCPPPPSASFVSSPFPLPSFFF